MVGYHASANIDGSEQIAERKGVVGANVSRRVPEYEIATSTDDHPIWVEGNVIVFNPVSITEGPDAGVGRSAVGVTVAKISLDHRERSDPDSIQTIFKRLRVANDGFGTAGDDAMSAVEGDRTVDYDHRIEGLYSMTGVSRDGQLLESGAATAVQVHTDPPVPNGTIADPTLGQQQAASRDSFRDPVGSDQSKAV